MTLANLPRTNAAAIDQIDQSLDMLNVIWCALRSNDDLEDEAVESIANMVALAMRTLKPARAAVNKAHGEGRI